jgi:hypothetical protein
MKQHSRSHHFSPGTKLATSIRRHIKQPLCHIKIAARTDYTGRKGLPLSEKTKKSFGSQLMTNRTFGKEYWRDPLFKLCQSRSKSGKVI